MGYFLILKNKKKMKEHLAWWVSLTMRQQRIVIDLYNRSLSGLQIRLVETTDFAVRVLYNYNLKKGYLHL